MHEKIADAFERVLTAIIVIVAVILGIALLASLASGGGIYGVVMVLAGSLAIVLTFGMASILISIRHRLISIDAGLRQRP